MCAKIRYTSQIAAIVTPQKHATPCQYPRDDIPLNDNLRDFYFAKISFYICR